MTDFKKLKPLEKTLNHRFKNKKLLLESLSHPSLKQFNAKVRFDYERLEFLGDTILNFIITEILFKNFELESEGALAKIRASLICTKTICSVAKDINLSEYIIMTQGEENTGGRKNPHNLENALEALVAAIYLDSSINKIKKIVSKLWAKYLDNLGNLRDHDPKSYLQEWSQKNGLGVPFYELLKKSGTDHDPLFTVEARIGEYSEIGEGKTIKCAQKEAATRILHLLSLKKGE